MRSLTLLILLVGLVFVATTSPAPALTDEEIFRDFRFNLINPGARSQAMGGAFVALADDATAAQANPAGLSFLVEAEYFAEIRVVDNGAESAIDRGTLTTDFESIAAIGTDIDDHVGASFLSAVTPYRNRSGRRWAMAVSRQELLRIDNRTARDFAIEDLNSPNRFLGNAVGSIEVDVVNINASVGVRLGENGTWALGATATYSRLDMDSLVVNQIVDTAGLIDDPNMPNAPEILAPTTDLRTSIDDTDEDVVFSLGAFYTPQTRRWALGAVYRRGPDFTVAEDIDPSGLDSFNVRQRLGTRFANRLHLPDVYSAGAHWLHERSGAVLAAEIERVEYSNLMDGFVSGVTLLSGPDSVSEIDDGMNYRVGVEYPLPTRAPTIALRGGAFREASSTIRQRFTGNAVFEEGVVSAVFDDDPQYHGTVGMSIQWEANSRSYKLDLAADFADSDNEYLVSFIYRTEHKSRKP